jgi:hypothetical protein
LIAKQFKIDTKDSLNNLGQPPHMAILAMSTFDQPISKLTRIPLLNSIAGQKFVPV